MWTLIAVHPCSKIHTTCCKKYIIFVLAAYDNTKINRQMKRVVLCNTFTLSSQPSKFIDKSALLSFVGVQQGADNVICASLSAQKLSSTSQSISYEPLMYQYYLFCPNLQMIIMKSLLEWIDALSLVSTIESRYGINEDCCAIMNRKQILIH